MSTGHWRTLGSSCRSLVLGSPQVQGESDTMLPQIPEGMVLPIMRPEEPRDQKCLYSGQGGAQFPKGALGCWSLEVRVMNQDWVLFEKLRVQIGKERYSESWSQAGPVPWEGESPGYLQGQHPVQTGSQRGRKEEGRSPGWSGEPRRRKVAEAWLHGGGRWRHPGELGRLL